MNDPDRTRPVRVRSRAAITPLGFERDEYWGPLREGRSALKWIEDPKIAPQPFYGGLLDRERVDAEFPGDPEAFPLFEKVSILAAHRAIEDAGVDPADPGLLFVVATTKGNVELLSKEARKGSFGQGREYLHRAAAFIADFWGNPNTPWVVSNACISGVLGIDVAADQVRNGRYEKAIVIGADVLSPFIVSGFQAFMALGSTPCRPYDKERDGLSLGEASAAMVLEEGSEEKAPLVLQGATSNDANHISGPSRTGEGLALAVEHTLSLNGMESKDIDHLNAHGTATQYNDEMEAKAFHRCALSEVPMNSFKGVFGHSLGAAGLVESVMCLDSMEMGELLPSVGYKEHGVTLPLDLIRERRTERPARVLKTASGFGGCNAALLFAEG